MKHITVLCLGLLCISMSTQADDAICKQTDANGVAQYGDCAVNAGEPVDVGSPNIAAPPPAIAVMNDARTSPGGDDDGDDNDDDSSNANDDCDDCGDYVDGVYVANPRAVGRALNRADDDRPVDDENTPIHDAGDRVRDGGGIRGGIRR